MAILIVLDLKGITLTVHNTITANFSLSATALAAQSWIEELQEKPFRVRIWQNGPVLDTIRANFSLGVVAVICSVNRINQERRMVFMMKLLLGLA